MKKELKGYHLSVLRGWYKNMKSCPNFETDLEAVAKYHGAISRYIERRFDNLGTKKNNYATLVIVLRNLGKVRLAERYAKKMNELANELNENARETQAMSSRERESWMSHEELVELLNTLRTNWEADPEDAVKNYQCLALAFYVMRPPLRLEPACLEIVGSEEEVKKGRNYLIRRSPGHYTLLIQKDKVSSTYGPLRDEIQGGLADLITASLKVLPRPYLFCQLRHPDQPMSSNAFGKFISRIGGRGITASMLRSSFITWIHNVPNVDLATKRRLACLMRHSPEAAELHYKKIDKPAEISLYM